MIEPADDALRGSYTPLVTPFHDGVVDHDAFEGLVERQVAGGSDGIVVTGTTGEPTSLSIGERAALYRRAVAAAGGRVAVVAATGATSHEDTLELTAAAVDAGADAVMVVAPGFVKPSQDGLAAHFTAVAQRTELPVLLYNIPGRSGVAIEVDTVARVAERCPNIAGVKSASKDLDYVMALLLRLGEGFRVFCGVESLSYPMLAVGGAGLMSAVGNVLPERVAALCAAVRAQDHGAALALHRELFAINEAIFLDTNPVPLKVMLAEWGIAAEEVRLPLAPASADTRRRVVDVLARYRQREVAQPA